MEEICWFRIFEQFKKGQNLDFMIENNDDLNFRNLTYTIHEEIDCSNNALLNMKNPFYRSLISIDSLKCRLMDLFKNHQFKQYTVGL